MRHALPLNQFHRAATAALRLLLRPGELEHRATRS
jgi:hypothetical protein